MNGYNIIYQQFIAIYKYTVVVRSALNGPDSSRILMCQHTELPCHR